MSQQCRCLTVKLMTFLRTLIKKLFRAYDSTLCELEEQGMGKLKVAFALATQTVDVHILHFLPYLQIDLYTQRTQVSMKAQWVKG